MKLKSSTNLILKQKDNSKNLNKSTLSSNLNITLYKKPARLCKKKYNMKQRLFTSQILKLRNCCKRKSNNTKNYTLDTHWFKTSIQHCNRDNKPQFMKPKLSIKQILKPRDNYKLKLTNIINCNQDIINYKINFTL